MKKLTLNMKHPLFLFSFILLFFAACQSGGDNDAMPEDLDGLKALLKTERAAMKEIQNRTILLNKISNDMPPYKVSLHQTILSMPVVRPVDA